MSTIDLGQWANLRRAARLDVGKLVGTRMLIQGNSGSGKSHCLRRILEQTSTMVQQIIFDPEGEFASLREKFDYVIAAPTGGDTVAHPATAKLLAERLVQTKVSAVLDIYDLQKRDREEFVRIFLETLMRMPKKEYGERLIVIDEAHLFCPEKGAGDATSTNMVIDVATRGRKRGLSLVCATQRISKFNKDAAAQLINNLIGMTTLDVDVKRAAFDLGMPAAEARDNLRGLVPGLFYGYGPALNTKIVDVVQVGDVATTHPKAGKKLFRAPPKPTAAIMAILPQLADLPAAAAEERTTIAGLQEDLRKARQEALKARQEARKIAPAPPEQKPEVLDRERQIAYARGYADAGKAFLMEASVGLEGVEEAISRVEDRLKDMARAKPLPLPYAASAPVRGSRPESVPRRITSAANPTGSTTPRAPDSRSRPAAAPQNGVPARLFNLAPEKIEGRRMVEPGLIPTTGLHKKVLTALLWLEHKGIPSPTREQVGAIAGVKAGGGYFRRVVGELQTSGMLTYPGAGLVSITGHGREFAGEPDTSGELSDGWLRMTQGLHRRVLERLLEHPDAPVTREELALSLNTDAEGGYFRRVIGELKTMGAIAYPQNGSVSLTRNVVP